MAKAALDAVVALGKNWEFPIEGKRIYLSLESKLTALAAAELYIQKQVKKIIYSGGQTAGLDLDGKVYPSEAEEMKKFTRIFFSKNEIPESAIELETKSIDTAGNAEEVKKIIKKDKLKNIALLTVGFHLPRAQKLFANYGVRLKKTYVSEDVLAASRNNYDNLLGDYNWSAKYLTEIMKEAVGLGFVYTIDPKGSILRKITTQTRAGGS